MVLLCISLLSFLPPAYVVRREGNVLTRVCPSVCPRGGGGQSSQQGGGWVSPARGVGGQSSQGVSPAGGVGGQSSRGGGSVQPGGGQSSRGGSVSWGGQLGGSAKIGQQNEYSLHGGQYAYYVHAGGLSCLASISI